MGKNRPYFVHPDTDPDLLKHVQNVEKGVVHDPELPKNLASDLLDQVETDRTPPFRHPAPLTEDTFNEFKEEVKEFYHPDGTPITD